MSLDVYLTMPTTGAPKGSGIFIREGGRTREISREAWDAMCPGKEPVVAIHEDGGDDGRVYSRNITHNLTQMADCAGLYKCLWRPDEIGIALAGDLIAPLTDGLARLQSAPDQFKPLNPRNGWGDYEGLVAFVADYLAACKMHPTATVSVWR